MAKAQTTQATNEQDAVRTPDFTKLYADYNRSFAEFGKYFANGKIPAVDFEAVMTAQRKNVEAFTAANRLAVEGMQAVTQRQMELVRTGFDHINAMVTDMTKAGSAEDKLATQLANAKKVFETALANSRELAGLVEKTGAEAVAVIADRVSANFDEAQGLFHKKSAK